MDMHTLSNHPRTRLEDLIQDYMKGYDFSGQPMSLHTQIFDNLNKCKLYRLNFHKSKYNWQ